MQEIFQELGTLSISSDLCWEVNYSAMILTHIVSN